MRVFRIIILSAALLAVSVLQLSAQNPANDISNAKSLYAKGLYSQAASIFAKYNTQESKGYEVLCLANMQADGYEAAIRAYLEAYPASGLLPMIYCRHGLNLFDKGAYQASLEMFNKTDASLVDARDRAEYTFKKAYANYVAGNGEVALHTLNQLDGMSSRTYKMAGAYLAGYILYEKGRYSKAEEKFAESVRDPRFTEISSYYIADCHYRRRDYKYLTKNADKLMKATTAERKSQMARMISESFLVSGDTDKAREYYALAGIDNTKSDRGELFYAGSLMYASGDYRGAISNFERMPNRTDSLGQTANYQLGYSYIKVGDKVSAMNSFKAASAQNYDPKIKEDAFFNSAKLSFDLNHDASVFNDYIAAYPSKKKNEMIFEYMALAALYDKDYARAVEAYDNIDELTPNQRNNYVKANYLRANQLISGGAWRDAVPYLKATAWYSDKNSAICQLANYWMAEAAFRDGDMTSSRNIYSDLYNKSALDKRPEGKALTYNIAYTYIKEDNSAMARRWLARYIASGDKANRRDALIREGDCYYVDRLYADAAKSYHAAVSEFGSRDDAYALYQEGMATGLAGNVNEKRAVLSGALELNPSTPYRNDAVYELGRSYVSIGRNDDAAYCFNDLITKSSDSTFIARSLIGLGMMAATEKKYEESAAYYKRVISELPESQYTEDALLALESVYQAMGNSQEYIAYIEGLGPKGSRSDADKERILFSGAEQTYLAGNWEKALASLFAFKEKYPGSDKTTAADYYIANCYNSLGSKDLAVDTYNSVLKDTGSSFREPAALELGRLLYGMENFQAAYEAFAVLEKIGTFDSNRQIAFLGMMESAFKSRKYQEALKAAEKVLSATLSTEDDKFEANYIKAKSLQSTGKREEAFKVYRALAEKPDTDYGAEANLILAQDAYDRGKHQEVMDIVYAFSRSGSTRTYYLAKAFLVLGDSFADQEEFIQAKATFESIRDGYKPYGPDDDIPAAVMMRLEKLAELKNEN